MIKLTTKTTYLMEERDRKHFRRQLLELDLSQRDCAKMLGVSDSYLSSVISGQRVLTQSMLIKLQNIGVFFNLG